MESIWTEGCHFDERKPLSGDIKVEIAVLGAGIAGLLTASALQKAGRRVVVLEANRIAGGQTRNTTAKITSQHGLIYRKLIDPGRFDAAAISGVAEEGAQAVKGLAKGLFQIPSEKAAAIPEGHGGVVFLHGEKVGVYKEQDGRLYPVSIRCPHLGCQLEWNPDERSWDCPCHGSRFDRFGNLISGPAQEDLAHG